MGLIYINYAVSALWHVDGLIFFAVMLQVHWVNHMWLQ